jgi:hypothetical protein
MRLPQNSAGHPSRARYGGYVAARLRAAGFADIAAAAEGATLEAKRSGRAVEDAHEPLQTALALRDGGADALKEVAQRLRLKLAAAGVDAVRRPPYTAIFPEGIGRYTAAPLDERVASYRELAARVEGTLPAGDPLREEALAAFGAALDAYAAACARVDECRTALGIARSARDEAVSAWNASMEKAYGALVAARGKRGAEPFFPRAERRFAASEDAAEGDSESTSA